MTTNNVINDSENGTARFPQELRLSAAALTQLRDKLLRADGNERVAYGALTPSGDSLLIHELYHVPDNGMHVSTPNACRPYNDVERRYLEEVISHDRHPLILHSHPFAADAWFSPRDDDLIAEYVDWLQPLYPDRTLVFGVLSQDSLACDVASINAGADEHEVTPLPVTVVGDWTLSRPYHPREDQAQGQNGQGPVQWERYDRNIRAIGIDGQHRLQDLHAAVIGCGGVGSHVAVALARLGVGTLTLVDMDRVERSNLSRLAAGTEGDIGMAKTRVVQEAIQRATPDCCVTTIQTPVQDAPAPALLKEADVLIGCVDQVTARWWLNEYAVRHVKPYIDVGVRIDVDSETDQIEKEVAVVQTVAPGSTACFDCLGRGSADQARLEQADDAELQEDLERGYITGADLVPEPAVIDLNLEATGKTVRTVRQLVTGSHPPPSLLRYDATSQDTMVYGTEPSQQCVTCGQHGVLAMGDYDLLPVVPESDASAFTDEPGALNDATPEQAPLRFPDTVTAFFDTWGI